MTRVLLLGGTGFIGDAAAAQLRVGGIDATTASRSSRADLPLDAQDPDALRGALASDFDVVVNLAGAGLSAGTADAQTMVRVNSELPAQILRTLDDLGAGSLLVHAASSTERLPGQLEDESEYSRTKHAGTQELLEAARASGRPVTILTFHNTYGPGQPTARFVASVTSALRTGQPVVLNHPHRVRDFVFIDDAAACIERATTTRPVGIADVHVGTGIGVTLMDAATTIAAALGADPNLVRSAQQSHPDPNPVTVCPDLAGTYGLCTTTFDEGIRRTIEES